MSGEGESQARLSLVEEGKSEHYYWGMFELSYINSGDQTAHIQNTHDFMVIDKKWLSETQFQEIYNLCLNLPGPTTVQVVITIITLKLKSLATTINCLLVYSIVPWLLLMVLGLLSYVFLGGDEKNFSMPLRMTIMGCLTAGAGIMLRSFFIYLRTSWNSVPKLILILVSAIIFYIYRSQNAIIFCLTLGGIISLYIEVESEGKKKMSSKS